MAYSRNLQNRLYMVPFSLSLLYDVKENWETSVWKLSQSKNVID